MDSLLFAQGESELAAGQTVPPPAGKLRLRVPHRLQVEMQLALLYELLQAEHSARGMESRGRFGFEALAGADSSP